MTTIKLKFRPSSQSGRVGTLCYQVIHHRQAAVIATDYHIYAHEWDNKHGGIKLKACDDSRRRAELQMFASKTCWEMHRMQDVVHGMEQAAGRYGMRELLAELKRIPPCLSVFCYIRLQIERKTGMGCYGTARTYSNVLRSFVKFRDDCDLSFADLNCKMIEEYEAWMLHAGLQRSSASCYIRTLRTLYRMGVNDGQVDDRDIFRQVHVSVGKTRKRAVSADVIRAILKLDLSGKPSLGFARDVFMFSFYTRGMSFVDMAHLRKSDLRNGLVTYNRSKTFQSLTIRWERPMQDIIDRYAEQTRSSPYLLPIIKSDKTYADRILYEQALQRVNRSLKRIGIMIGLEIPLTTYVARHSWASIARNMNVPLSVISEGLGHDSDKTTQIYLASLDTAMINKANKMIMNNIMQIK